MLIGTKNIWAQLPYNDPAWQIQTALSDSFNGSSINTSKWDVLDNYPDFHGVSVFYSRNIRDSLGCLYIKADTLIPSAYSYNYQSGSINSKDTSFRYGYLEMRAKYPTGHVLYWPAFWLWMGNCSNHWYNEVDICENGPGESFNGHEMGTNICMNLKDTCNDSIAWARNHFIYGQTITGLPKVDSAFHIYALKWDANNLYYLFDNNVVRHIYDADGDTIAQHHLQLVFDFYITNPNWLPYTVSHMPPANFVIDYFNYFTLTPGPSNCSTVALLNSGGYDRKVYQGIKTNPPYSQNFSPTTTSGSYTLRATDYVLLDAPTGSNAITINPSGIGYFAIEITPCPN